jgi:SAM-dependent methyltransferase
MKPIVLRLVLALLVSTGCGTIPGQDVRYEPTPMPVVRALLELAEVGPQDLVFDLGSGDGRIPITAAKEFGARGVGIEIDPALVTHAQANAREAGVEDKVEFRLGDMYASDVRPATVVTLFLNPGPNLKLREKLRSDLQAGSRVVSYVWDMGSWKPTESRRVNDHRIFLWRIRDRSSAQQITRSRDQPICIASPFMLCARYPMNPLARSGVACITIGAMSDPIHR